MVHVHTGTLHVGKQPAYTTRDTVPVRFLIRDCPPRMIPATRITSANEHPFRRDGQYVVYWMIAQRRLRFNFALQHAVDRAIEFGVPLIVLEPLRVRYPWASDRLHRFVIEGMRENAQAAASLPITYYPYVEPRPGAGTPLLHRLAERAVTVVTDEYPCFFLPAMITAVRDRIPARLELVDSNGLLPLRLAPKTFTVAHSYRRHMQRHILDSIAEMPTADPADDAALPRPVPIDAAILKRWPEADFGDLLDGDGLSKIPIDHDVAPTPDTPGGAITAGRVLAKFVDSKLADYNEDRNHPDETATSGLSAYMHFGHISPFEFVSRVLERENWTPDQAAEKPNGKNAGFFNVGPSAEAVLDQVLTWREIGFNWAFLNPQTYDKFESLPDWAQATLAETASDPREVVYSLEQFETAATHDEVWNAAQREIVTTGKMHNYMRMLWGKKILQWSATPRDALATMIHLNNKYGLDGRDPNSYCGILWVLGRTDRAWGPKRPIFGSVRYMTSDSARRKLKLNQYLRRFGGQTELF